jgi:hypothetical protein
VKRYIRTIQFDPCNNHRRSVIKYALMANQNIPFSGR